MLNRKNINGIKDMFLKLDKKVIELIDIGLSIGFIICAIGVVCLIIEYKFKISEEFYNISLEVFKLGLIEACSFLFIGSGLGIIKEYNKN